jgi:hemoglobin
MRKNLMIVAMAVAVAFGSLAPGLTAAQDMGKGTMAKRTLYSRLGGKKAITAVVDEFVVNVEADNRINKFFSAAASDPKRLAMFKGKLVDQICQGTGGPCKYRGKDMKTAHRGMGINEAEFNALVEDLVAALNKFNVPQAEQDELLGILGPMKGDIVGQ